MFLRSAARNPVPRLTIARMILTPGDDDLARYLDSTDVVDWDRADIRALARSLTSEAATAVERARAAYEWMQAEVPHSADAGRDEVTCSASEVLRLRTGICFAQSHLLAALLRASAVPAGFVYQLTDADGGPHGFNGAWLEGAWVALDARGTAPFSLAGSLADPNDPLLDGIVYPAPLPNVVRALRQFEHVTELWDNLPNRAGITRS